MAFNATSVTLENGLRSLREVAAQEKNYLGIWNTALSGNIDATYALNVLANLDRAITIMDTNANLTGMAAYAQQQLGSATYDIAAEYNSMRNALDALRSWLKANIPSNAITITNGAQVPTVFPPSSTAPLKSLVVSAMATIS